MEHGGNIDWAIANYGGEPGEWVDLSTGINPVAYPVEGIENIAWQRLPTRSDMSAAIAEAKRYYKSDKPCVAIAGAQAAIQLLPRMLSGRRAAILSPTYNEHAQCFLNAGWQVSEVKGPENLRGNDVAVIVNPNNPDGRSFTPAEIEKIADTVGVLIVDESFGDTAPAHSVAHLADDRLIVLKSFGKFFGLAGVRLGFSFTGENLAETFERELGSWPVSGPALHLAAKACADREWQLQTLRRLAQEAQRLDRAFSSWNRVGGTDLFRLYETTNARAAQAILAQHRIWSRVFSYSDRWVRLGLPGTEKAWNQVESAALNL